MRKKFILDTKNKRGITLVSLVVTIIVLLILAGITINLIIGEDGIIKRAQQAGKNYIDAAENEKVQLGQFTNEMDNIIGGTTSNGREPYNSEFRKNVVEAIKNAGVATTENDTDETIVANIGKILKEATKEATATADNISEGKTAWVNGELITGNGKDNASYIIKKVLLSQSCNCSISPGQRNTSANYKFDLTTYPGYQNFNANDNFAIYVTAAQTGGDTWFNGGVKVSSYENGILTVTAECGSGNGAYGNVQGTIYLYYIMK